MKFEKAFVVCPECKKVTYAYLLTWKIKKGVEGPFISIAKNCVHCGESLIDLHKVCKKCGFTDWADVFIGSCPYCDIENQRKKAEKGERYL